MGMTHYWHRPTELPREHFVRAVNDCRTVLATLDVSLAGFDGTGTPIYNDERIVVNGRSPQHCEPFEVARVEFDRRGRDVVRSFCKTESLPYNVCVQAALIVLKHHMPGLIHVSSDVGLHDWSRAVEVVIGAVGYGEDFRLDESDE